MAHSIPGQRTVAAGSCRCRRIATSGRPGLDSSRSKTSLMPRANCNETDAKFRAFSDQTRLRILHLLQGGELCVNDLVEIIDVPQPTASRHLAYLRRAELVVTRKAGQWTFYGLAPAQNPFHKKLLEC